MAEQNEKTSNEAPVFRLQKMYVKDLSFESPNTPGVFVARNTEPKVDFNLQLKNKAIENDNYEVAISITAKVVDKKAEDNVLFILEIEHAGVFYLKNIPEEHLGRVMAVDCPLMLFPFTRQIVSQVSVDGGFMPFLMEPINFVALYENAKKEKADA
ncbi:MAG: protein-export chaperone SecB [Desulfobulbus propionicus]|nr:MAG: protein-export chaperone SecB [Desulfobulbus propionicus]